MTVHPAKGWHGAASGILVLLNHLFLLESQGVKVGTNLVDNIFWLPWMHQVSLLEMQESTVIWENMDTEQQVSIEIFCVCTI